MIVQKQAFRIPELMLQSGARLEDVHIGYETYGTLNSAGTNAILIAHYFSGTSHCAGRFHESDPEPGYWDAIIGPGKAIDTNKYFVISADSIANVNAKVPHVISTGPSSIDPQTGRPYGSKFPVVSVADFVVSQKRLCDSLGIKHLHAVAGPSMGAFQSFEWAARYPHFVDRVMPVIPAGLALEPYLISSVQSWCMPILLDPDFQGGDYYGTGREPLAGLTQCFKLMTLNALHQDWAQRLFQRRWADERDPAKDMNATFAVERALDDAAKLRAQSGDANAILRTARAVQLFNIQDRKHLLRQKFLLIPAASDLMMAPPYFDRGLAELKALGLPIEVFVLQGSGGHLDGVNSMGQADHVIRKFLDS